MIPDRLDGAEWLARPAVQAIFAVLDGAEGKTRAVGGVVRDSLIGVIRDKTDIDMATELLPVTVMQRAKAAGIAAYPTGIDHGTVTLVVEGTSVEVTTLRRDVATDGRHAEVQFGTDWVEDARRRDFSINALYCAADGTLFDPLGGGGDLLNGRVRFIGDAAQRIAEDGLRVFRFFRFSASHGREHLDPDGLAACRDAAGRLDHISAERIGAEMLRMLALPAVGRTLAVMAEIGLLDVTPDAVRALLAYEQLGGQDPAARLALLGIDMAVLQSRWRLANAVAEPAGRVAAAADLAADDRLRWAAYRFGEQAVEGLAVAAARGFWPRERLMEAARELGRLEVAPLPVGGRDLVAAGIPQGPELGAILNRLERDWVESDFSLTREDLLASIQR